MKLYTILQLIFALLVTSWMLWLTIENLDQPKVVYIHSEYLFEHYQGTIESYKSLEVKTKKWSDNLDSLSQIYQTTYKIYESQKEELTNESKKELELKLQTQENNFNKYHRSIQEKRQKEDANLTQGVIKQIDTYLKEYAEEQGFDIVLGTSSENNSLVYGSKAYDITDNALVYINKKYYGK